jgi:4-oxalocrotonate tautomerase
MPVITVQHLAGAFTRQQQNELMKDITEAVVRQGGEGIRPATIVVITEVADGLWSYGGNALTLAEVETRRKARAAKADTGND